MFFYTCLILVLVVGVFFTFFHDQLQTAVTLTQQRQLGGIFQPLLESLHGKPDEEVVKIASAFHAENRSFQFCLENSDGSVLYETDDFSKPDFNLPIGEPLIKETLFEQGQVKFNVLGKGSGDSTFLSMIIDDKRFYVSGLLLASSVFDEIFGDIIISFSLIFAISLIAAAFFAHRIAKPIRTLTMNTRKMAEFKDAPAFPERGDEIGLLAKDVYLMHHNLKDAINRLEDEIKREREMEENQRYFFSAASHELKTPIAAAGAILEGMAEGVIEPEEYPQYINETLRLMKEQGALVTEILDIVKINDRMTKPVMEEINLLRLLKTTLESFYPIFDIKEQALLLDIDEDTVIRADPRLLAKALANILQNATQNSPQGAEIHITAAAAGKATVNKKEGNRADGPEDSLVGSLVGSHIDNYEDSHEISREVSRADSRIILSVENGGAHIVEENLPKLFEPFYVEDEARSAQKGRNGLGLTIVKRILDLMGMPFDLHNTEGGVRFSVTLPCTK
jgi:two-component system sensor histidine kinase VanS